MVSKMKIGQQCKMRDTAPVLYGADLATFIVHGRRRYLYHTENTTVKLVEAAGVEPASEKVTGQETTCLFAFMPQAFGALRRFSRDVRGPRSERTRNASR